jgi:hypothetical protein
MSRREAISRLVTIASLLRTNIHSVDTRADERINRRRDL